MPATLKKLFNKLSLSEKFSAAVIINIGLMMIVVNWLVISHQRGALKAEMEGSHRVVVKNLSTDAAEPLILMDPLRLDDLVRTIRQTPGCEYAGVLDPGEGSSRTPSGNSSAALRPSSPRRPMREASRIVTNSRATSRRRGSRKSTFP